MRDIYHHRGWLYGFCPCKLHVYRGSICRYRPYWWSFPLWIVAAYVHLMRCGIVGLFTDRDEPRQPFFFIKTRKPFELGM